MLAPLRLTAATLALTVGVLGSFASWMSNTDARISRGFMAAVETTGGAAPRSADSASVDWSHLHLSGLPAALTASAAVALGDSVTIAGQDGHVQSYAVVDIRPLDDQPLLLVTARSLAGASSGASTGTLRFVVDAAPRLQPAVPPAKPHAL